jgi:hypothetical protein
VVPVSQVLLYAHLTETPLGTASVAYPFGTSGGMVSSNSTLPVVISSPTFSLPIVGYYLVGIGMNNEGNGTVLITSHGANVTFTNCFADYVEDQQVAEVSGQAVTLYVMRVLASGTTSANYVTLSPNTLIEDSTLDVFISQIPSFN